MDISRLTAGQKRELLDQLKYELEGAGRKAALSSFTEAEEELWEAGQAALGIVAAPGKQFLGLPTFVQGYGQAKFLVAAEQAREYVEYACSVKLRKPQRMVVLEHCMAALCKHLLARKIPATMPILCNSMPSLASAVDRRFPGYADSGLLHRIAVSPRGRDGGGASSR